jgi:hypothetical protein
MDLKRRCLVHDPVSLGAQRLFMGQNNIEGRTHHAHSSRWALCLGRIREQCQTNEE